MVLRGGLLGGAVGLALAVLRRVRGSGLARSVAEGAVAGTAVALVLSSRR